ncbi:MAG: biopolymer transporter ExbD [Spirochaetes bacterium]|nr:biopolymer transporter ExbD [Spirochaetota bacterium]
MIRKRIRPSSAIPVSAMADIAFLLLIFFILSNVSEDTIDIKMDLPQSHISEQETQRYFNVWVDEKGDIFFGGKKGTAQELTSYARFKMASNPQTKALIRASKTIKYEHINAIFESLKEAGVHNIVLVSKKK